MAGPKRPWRGAVAGWLLALGVLALWPEAASAQPSALLPDIYIHRQRPCNANEDPRYQYYRENYFGYFPTCWRRFPDTKRWNCPNPEAPNWEEALKKLPLEVPPTLGAGEGEGGDATQPRMEPDPFARPGGREAEAQPLPDLPPDEDSLFRRPGATPPARREPTPPAGVEPPGTAPDPFAPAPTPEPGSRAEALEAPPTLAPPATGPSAIPAARRFGGPRDDAMQRTSRDAPRRGLFSGLLNRPGRQPSAGVMR